MGSNNLINASVQMTNKHLHLSSRKCKTKPQLNITVHQYGEGNGTRLQYFCLENPMDGEAW